MKQKVILEKINRIDKPLARWTKEKGKEKTNLKILKSEIKMGTYTVDPTEIKKNISEYCEELYTNKLEYLDEMNIFLETRNL